MSRDTHIDPSACVSLHAELGAETYVGPYCIVGPNVKLGDRTRLESHVVISGSVQMGSSNHVFPFAVLGGPPQDRRHKGDETSLVIGDLNIIREYVSFNRGSSHSGGCTRVGSRGFFMAHSHVGHDCQVGDDVVMANSVALAGHVKVGQGAVLGGLAGIHQFVRIGRLAMVGAGSMVSQDVPPFLCVQGDRARLKGLNRIGLRRAEFSADLVRWLRHAYRLLFLSGKARSEALAELELPAASYPELHEFISFIRASGRGICRHGIGSERQDGD